MTGIRINSSELRDKIYGCWLGKNIGGTLGGPYEGLRELLDVKGYTSPAGEPLPNDDLDLQLVWLKAFQDYGPRALNSKILGEYWLNFIPPFWNEYGISKANQRAGLVPPLTGEYRNNWKDSNGAWIRSEIWACLAPGCPDLAIRYAYEDASVDHGSGEGTYAALFTAAVQSAAFVVSDRDELIRIGLSKVPPDCRLARSIGVVMKAYADGASWQQARELVMADSADLGWFQSPANVAFVIIGWMYGEGDFGRSIITATNCGDDTDCTAATLGAILGIVLGREKIPAEWAEPLGDRIMTIAIDRGSIHPPATLAALTDQVMTQVPISLTSHRTNVEITDAATDLSLLQEIDLKDSTTAQKIWDRSSYAVEYDFVHTRVMLDYGVEPDIIPGVPFPLKVTLFNQMPDMRHMELIWHLPDGWQVLPGSRNHLTLFQHPPQAEVCVEVVAHEVSGGTCRGILEIVVPGRPTVGLVPLVFFCGI